MSKKKLDLVAIIKANPGCVAVIYNDCWYLYKQSPDKNPHADDDEGEAEGAWEADNELASSNDPIRSLGDGGYGSGCCCYGGDILQALAVIVGIKVESV